MTTIVLSKGEHVVGYSVVGSNSSDDDDDEDETNLTYKQIQAIENDQERQDAYEKKAYQEYLAECSSSSDEKEEEDNCLSIWCDLNIVGHPNVPKEEIVIVGGLSIEEGNVQLHHLTICGAKGNGVSLYEKGILSMEDVLVTECGNHGVYANGWDAFLTCTNVEVRQCGGCGVSASGGAYMVFVGDMTMVSVPKILF